MLRRLVPILLLPLLGLIFFACADSIDKTTVNSGDVRVEFSKCTGCGDCINFFTCPEGAISLDTAGSGAAFIDSDKCISCMKCIDLFHCPDSAFTTVEDITPPAAITDLTAVSNTVGELTIRFTAPGDDGMQGMAYRYEVSITGPNGEPLIPGYDPPLPSLGGMTENWPLCELPQDITATVRVQAFDEENNHNARVEQSCMITGIVIDETPPAQIIDLSATAGEADITLAWTAPGDDGMEGSAASYDLRYSASAIDATNWSEATQLDAPTPAAAGTQQSLVLTDVPQQTELFFSIRAADESDNTAPPSPNAQAATTGDITPPDAIDDLTVGSTSTSTIMVQWTAVGDNGDEGQAEAYVIKLHTEPITEANWAGLDAWPNSLNPQPAGANESFVFSGLSEETTYYIAVEAMDDAGNTGPVSNVAQGVTEGSPDTTPPAAIGNLSVQESRADLTLSWSAPGDDGDDGTASAYDIRMSSAPITEANFADADQLPSPPTPQQAGNTEFYFVTGADAGMTWYFAIKASDDAANVSALSNVASIQLTEDTTPPAAIADLSVTETYATNGRITINWSAPGDDGDTGVADHYDIRYSMQPITEDNWEMNNSVISPPDPASPGTSQSCNVDLLENGVIYHFAVRAVDENGNMGAISNACSGKIVYVILSSCHDCARCISRCPHNAIYDTGPRKAINPDLCDACGTCQPYCPWNLIRMWAKAY